MLRRLHQFRRWAGVDRAVFFSNATQLMRLVTGPITLALVLRYLTPEIQGYYYAFAGVVAMQVFLELGFSQNILQFAAHEFSQLHFTAAKTLEGDAAARSRLISLGRLAFGYYAVAAVIVLLTVGIGGHVFFTISSNRFSAGSFQEMKSFAAQLEQPADPASKFLSENLSPATRLALKNFQADESALKILETSLSKDLNALVKHGPLADDLRKAGSQLRPETKQLLDQNPHGEALVHLNRLLLEDAFPREIIPNRVAWQGAWWIIALTAALSLAINPAWSLLEGCNQVAVIAQFRFWAVLASFAANAVALILGTGIYASAWGSVAGLLFSLGYLGLYWRSFLGQFRETPRYGRVSWAREIWPFQWRIAVSWIAGYFVFDIINPIALYYCGPVDAGRLGMSFQLVRMIYNVSVTWVSTKVPRFGVLVAAKAWRELDSLWRRSALQSFIICVLGMASFLAAIPFIGLLLPKIPARLAPLEVNAWLAGAMVVQTLIGAMAVELRAHKREPFVWMAVANAVLSIAFILPLVRHWGIAGEAMGYALAIWAVFLPAWKIYCVKRLNYRAEADGLRGRLSSAGKPEPASGNFPSPQG